MWQVARIVASAISISDAHAIGVMHSYEIPGLHPTPPRAKRDKRHHAFLIPYCVLRIDSWVQNNYQ